MVLKAHKPRKHLSLEAVKNPFRTRFFLIINIVILSVVFSLSAISQIKQTENNLKSRQSDLVARIKRVFDLSQDKQLGGWSEINGEINQILSPAANALGLTPVLSNDLTQITNLFSQWQLAVSSLTNYTVNAEGITSKSGQKNFTDDLEKFFEQLPDLQAKTNSVYNSLWYYRLLLHFQPNAKISLYFEALKEVLDLIPSVYESKREILTTLGHYSTQRIVIFNQNTGEARPTGGFLGSFLALDISKGRLSIGQSQSIYYVDGQKKYNIVGHPSVWGYDRQFGFALEHGIRNLNMLPCFPDTAGLLQGEFSNSRNGYAIDALILVTPQLISSLIPPGQNIDLPEVGVLNSDNLLEEIERLTSLEASDRENPKSVLSPIFQAIIQQLPGLIEERGRLQIIAELASSMSSRDLQIWFRDLNVQNLWQTTGLAANELCQNVQTQPIIAPMLINLSGDKRNLASRNRYSLFTSNTVGGIRVHVKYQQELPDNPLLQRQYNLFDSLTWVGLQIPGSSNGFKIDSPQGLNFPFLRPYYEQLIQEKQNLPNKTPEAIRTITQSGVDLNKGFVYTQPDGSKVLGIYVQDEQITEVEFSFVLPITKPNLIQFYTQPGLNEPTLDLGDKIALAQFSDIRTIKNPKALQTGIDLIVS
jgi:Protein of unknown function (DUF4012)